MCSIVFGDTMVPIIEQNSILPLGYCIYITNITLPGSTTKTTLLRCVRILKRGCCELPGIRALEGLAFADASSQNSGYLLIWGSP